MRQMVVRRVASTVVTASLLVSGCVSAITRPTLAPAGYPSAVALLAPGTVVPVVAAEPISSSEDQALRAPVLVAAVDVPDDSGSVVIRAGAPVDGIVVSRGARRIGRPGWVYVELRAVQAVDGTYVPLVGAARLDGRGRRGAAIGLGISMSLVFSYIGPLFLLIRGCDVRLDPGVAFPGVVGTPGEGLE